MAHDAGPTITPPGTAITAAADDPSELRLILQALRAEIQYLTRKIDQTWADRADSVDLAGAAAHLTDIAEILPTQILNSLATVLESQRQAIMVDVYRVIDEKVSQAAFADVLVELPARLAIQLTDLSNRFGQRLTDLGDKFEQLLVSETAIGSSERRMAERNSAILTEIEQLTRVVAGTVELLAVRDDAG